jgi:hypothetical protein
VLRFRTIRIALTLLFQFTLSNRSM